MARIVRSKKKRKVTKKKVDTKSRCIASFWRRFKKKTTTAGKLSLLKSVADTAIFEEVDKETLLIRRKEFDKHKKQYKLDDCQVCLKDAFNRHHIIQLQNGGPVFSKNVIVLCEKCHKTIHPWMK